MVPIWISPLRVTMPTVVWILPSAVNDDSLTGPLRVLVYTLLTLIWRTREPLVAIFDILELVWKISMYSSARHIPKCRVFFVTIRNRLGSSCI